jgi:regulator of nonsense transcripts 1
VSSSVDHLTLHKLITKLNSETNTEYRKILELKEIQGDLNSNDDKKFKNLNKITEKKILKAADVICCTCVGAGDGRLANLKFNQVIIDESTQATEPECNKFII